MGWTMSQSVLLSSPGKAFRCEKGGQRGSSVSGKVSCWKRVLSVPAADELATRFSERPLSNCCWRLSGICGSRSSGKKTCQKNDWEMMLGVFLIVACRVGRGRAVHLDTNSAALCAPQTRTLTGVSFLMLLSDLYHHLKLLKGVTFLESLQNGLSALYDPGKRHISLYD